MVEIIPADSRYVPIQQQPYCCGPACLTMVMIRNGIKPLPQELIGYYLGLVVPSDRKHEFWNPRHAEKPVVASGFGTQIQNEKEFGMEKALRELNIPLHFKYIGADQIGSIQQFKDHVISIIQSDEDVLVCLNWGGLTGLKEQDWGHILCIDAIRERDVRLIDPDGGAKWKTFSIESVFTAMKHHGNANYGGLWVFRALQPIPSTCSLLC